MLVIRCVTVEKRGNCHVAFAFCIFDLLFSFFVCVFWVVFVFFIFFLRFSLILFSFVLFLLLSFSILLEFSSSPVNILFLKSLNKDRQTENK